MLDLEAIRAERDRRSPIWAPLPGPQYDAYHSQADELFYGGAAGGGKALALGTPLPTPDGWTTIGEVRVGDTLFDEHGRPSIVLACSDVMRDHDCYEVVFSDGASLVADAGHHWQTKTYNERSQAHRRSDAFRERRREVRPSRATGKRPDLALANGARVHIYKEPPAGGVRTTREIAETLTVGGRINHAVTVCDPLQIPDRELPLDPYVLGAWLGDGHTANQGFTCFDPEIIGEIRGAGYEVRPRGRTGEYGLLGILPALRAIGALGHKHVPGRYLRAGVRQRLALLQGLMDTDGYADDRGQCEFTTTSPELRDGITELLNSLGIKAASREGRATIGGKDCGPKWRVKFLTGLPAFRLPRKLARQKREGFRGTHSTRYVVDARPVPSVPVRCVAVDSPSHLYLAGAAMVPTHNSDLLLGLALTSHHHALILRREYKQLKGLIDRSHEILSGRDASFNQTSKLWQLPGGAQVEFGAVQYAEDVRGFQGRPHDLLEFDELPNFLESQYLFLSGWARTTRRGQRVRRVSGGNPPTSAEGEWVIKRWGAWLDGQHPHPAEPGELRWYAQIEGKDQEVETGEPFSFKGELITPLSRTFIPARLTDNPHLMATGYANMLQSMPEPLRSQLLYGDFGLSLEDDIWQIIPTAWVRAAQARWSQDGQAGPLSCIGVDVARGGKDKTVLQERYGNWFGWAHTYPGSATPNGRAVAALAGALLADHAGDRAYLNVDVIGVGSSAYDAMVDAGFEALPVNFASHVLMLDRTGTMRFVNLRAYAYWSLREALDPEKGDALQLPPDPELLADLTAPRWEMRLSGIQVEDKDEIIKRIGRSPDKGDALALSALPDMSPRVS